MDIVETKIHAIKNFQRNIGSSISIILNDIEYAIIDMNIQDQLYEQGIERNGIDIFENIPYGDMTVQMKMFEGKPFDRVTLRDEGDFHSSFKLRITANEFEIYATDIKTESLIAKYGESILGLTDENFAKVTWDFVYPQLHAKLIEYLKK